MRLVTFNLLHGRSLIDQEVDLDRLRAAVRVLDPDVLALQEVDREQPRSHLADLTAVAAEAMGAVAHRFAPAILGTPGPGWPPQTDQTDQSSAAAYGIALLSRYPATNWQVHRLPRVPVRFPMWGPRQRRLIMMNEEPRALVSAELATPAGPVTVANTHLSFLPGWGQFQLIAIRRRLASVSGPVVLMGDLNLSAPQPARITGYRPLARHATFPADDPWRQIDHILLRGRLGRVVGSSAPRLTLSDHRALVVDLDLDQAGARRRESPD